MGCAIQEIVNENPKPTKNHYSQHHQQTPTTLKSQHTALVKLLESAPITGSKTKTVTNYASPRQQQKTTTTQQPQQIKSNNDTSSIRISNSNVNACDVVSKTNSCKNQKNDHESGIDEDIGDDSDKINFKLINTKNQCPWKKIRYAREWKQRELLSDENSSSNNNNNSNLNEISKCDNTELTKRLTMEEQDTKHHQQLQQQHQQQEHQPQSYNNNIQHHPHHIHNHHQQQPDDITSQMQQQQHQQQMQQPQLNQNHRRDSSDSNSSVASLSCTCSSNIPQDNEDDCDCQQDSGCDDEMNGSNGTMNYLCQKFNDGFFRRSIQQKIQYRPCTKNQQCSILRINRNRCQYCRLKKCIAVGMSRDAVRFGRVPKREKARILAAMQQSTQNRGQQRALTTELDDEPRLLAAVLRAHMETCEFTKEKVASMRQRARECPSYSMPTLLACPLNPAPELQSEQEFSQRFAHVIRGVIDFAGMIPGFQLLSQDDKFTLLKAGLFDALFVRLICMFDSSINSIICLNGQVMRRDAIQNGANARFLVDSTFNFAERMNSMNLTDAEIGLFCAIVLITPDRPGLRNLELIEKMYSRLKKCLQTIINQNRPDQPEFMAKLLETLPDLRTLSTLHTEKLVVFRTEHKELLRQQMWSIDDEQPSNASKSPSWDDSRMDEIAKSPLGSVSSTESGDMECSSQSSLASSAPLLAATLSGGCPMRHRANSGGSSGEEIDIVGSHAHLTQNGLTITPIVRSQSQMHQHQIHSRYRKLDSPTDSGIESGNEKAESTKTVSSGGSSSCSSPRSSVDDAMETEQSSSTSQVGTTPNQGTKRQIVEDMPVLKRVLQAPPLYDTNSLMDEAYKPHKKFRALRQHQRDYETAEADATITTAAATTTSTTVQQQSQQQSQSQPLTQQQQQQIALSPPTTHQSQLHMHLTRTTPATLATIRSQSPAQQQSYSSSLSSTHSVLAKSLMDQPRMTPEQIKRSDIIQNYIMRGDQTTPVASATNLQPSLLVCAGSPQPNVQHYSPASSPSTTTITLTSPPPPQPSQQQHQQQQHQQQQQMRWQGHSVITTSLRQQSLSPNAHIVHFQSPHSTSSSASVSPRPRSHSHSPRLLELQVDIADSQQPLNLSKKSPSPPPTQQQQQPQLPPTKLAISHKYADVTVTATPSNSTAPPTAQVH